MKETKLGKVRQVALHVIKINSHYYSKDLMSLIPTELLNVDLTDGNLHETGIKIDEIRFQKEEELAQMFASSYEEAVVEDQLEELTKALNSDIFFSATVPCLTIAGPK